MIKVSVAGAWKAVIPSVKIGGVWKQVKTVSAKESGSWKTIYREEWVYTFATGWHYDIDLDTIAGLYKSKNVRIVIPNGAHLVGSTTSQYGLKTGSGYSGTLTIENEGRIWGRGGDGGDGGHAAPPGPPYYDAGDAGGNGGAAILVETDFNLILKYAHGVQGGSGGGGGGYGHNPHGGANGGGGGGGVPKGSGGAGVIGYVYFTSQPGADALLSAGAGGAGAPGVYNIIGGPGGDGGGTSSAKSAGYRGSFTWAGNTYIGAVGGQAGADYVNNGDYTVTITGDLI